MYEAIVIGASAGGIRALATVLSGLAGVDRVAIAIVQHRDSRRDGYLAEYLAGGSGLRVREAEDKEPFMPSEVYLAPPGYHLLIEEDHTLSLSVDDKVHFSRPSIDILFASAADVFGPRVIGVVLTGANEDGAEGLARIRRCGGIAIVQSPEQAEARRMPEAALAAVRDARVLDLEDIAPSLLGLMGGQGHGLRRYA